MDFLTLARERFSVLEYEYRDVEAEKLEKILAAALAAPTACNLQPQRIVLIDTEEKRQKLNDAVPGGHFAPAAFLVCYDSRACWVRPQDGKSSGEIDASIAATHMMLEATDLGLGSIWVMSWDVGKVKETFALEAHIEPVALLIVGYRAANAAPRQGHFASKTREDILLLLFQHGFKIHSLSPSAFITFFFTRRLCLQNHLAIIH